MSPEILLVSEEEFTKRIDRILGTGWMEEIVKRFEKEMKDEQETTCYSS